MGRNAAKELVRIVDAIGSYLGRAESDSSLGLSYDAIELATGVSRGHLSRRKEPEMTALVSRIAAIKHDRVSAAPNSVTGAKGGTASAAVGEALSVGVGAVHALPAETLAKMIARSLAELARLQQQWLARHATGHVSDAPLALHDGDVLLVQLRRSMDRMRPLVTEWNRRAAAIPAASDLRISEPVS